MSDSRNNASVASECGFTLLQLMIVFAIVAVISTFAVINISKSRDSVALQNSVRQLAGYLEKARLDAVRRHVGSTNASSVIFTSTTGYSVTMDFDGTGTPQTRTFSFQNSLFVSSTPLPSLTFNWRGRISACTVHFTIQNLEGEQSWVDVSDAGDVTVNSNANVMSSNTSFDTSVGAPALAPSTVVTGNTAHNNTVDCSADANPPPGPPAINTGAGGCTLTVSPSSVSIRKNGFETASIVLTSNVNVNSAGTVTVTTPVNLKVTPASQNMTNGGSVTFSITSLNNARSTWAVSFTSHCTTQTVLVTVTN